MIWYAHCSHCVGCGQSTPLHDYACDVPGCNGTHGVEDGEGE